MIDVKGSKKAQQETDPSQRFRLKDDVRTKTPMLVGLFLVSVALYLKAMFPSLASNPDASAPEEEPIDAKAPATQEIAANEQALDALREDSAPVGEGPVSSASRAIQSALPARFMVVNSPEFGFLPPEAAINWNGFNPYSRPANDNSWSVAPEIATEAPQVAPGVVEPVTPAGPSEQPSDADCDETGDDACEEDEEEVQSPNRAPRVTGPVYLMDVSGCAILTIALSDLLANAVDPDGDALTVRNLSVSSGTIVQSQGGWLFQGSPHLLGDVTISYEISDGHRAVGQSAHFSVVKSFVEGSNGDDSLLGTMCADDIDAGDGNDNIDGRAGDDTIFGGHGDDHVMAGSGDDTVFGDVGCDIIFGGAGNDHISGGAGNDRLFGEGGNDILSGDAGDDYLSGGSGDDLLLGGAGDDVLSDGTGQDTLRGDAGNDSVVAALDGEDDYFDGGDGRDTLDYSNSSSGINVDLVTGIASGVEIGNDTISGFEVVVGGAGNDYFISGKVQVTLVGGAGANTFEFKGGEATGYQSASEQTSVFHEILDFKVGDRIRMSKYDLFERVLDEIGERFEDIYGDEVEDDDIAIRYRHDRSDEIDRTIIEADFNKDNVYETTVHIQGHHVLVVVEHV